METGQRTQQYMSLEELFTRSTSEAIGTTKLYGKEVMTDGTSGGRP